MNTLEELVAKFKADINIQAGNPAAAELYTRLSDLTGHVLRISKLVQSDDQPIPDLVTNLQIENADLKKRLAALSEMERIVEDTRTALRQDRNSVNGTAARLPVWAGLIMAELDKLKGAR